MNTVLLKDPRININNPEDIMHVVTQSGTRLTQYIQPSNSSSTNQTNFSFQPPSTKTIVDRYMQLRMKVLITAVGGTFNVGVESGLRQLPLASIMDVLNVSINGGNVSDNVSRRIHPMMRFNNDMECRNRYINKTASMPDQFQAYDDWKTAGSNRNPLASYGEVGYEQSRGGFVQSGGNGTTTLEYVLTEPLFLSPLLNGLEAHSDAGLVNVNQIDINIKWVSDLQRIFCHYNEAPNALTGVTVEFVSQPELLVNYITPDLNMSLPLVQVLPYHKHNDYIKEFTLAAGASEKRSSDTIKLNQIPRHIMLFAKRSRGSQTLFTSDTFASIENVEILWNNESSLLSTHSKQGLFDISKRNGCNLVYAQWDKFCGSVLKLEMGVEIQLPSGLAPSVIGQYTIQANVTFKNTSDETIDYEFYLTTVLEGSVQISENSFSQNLGNLTVQQVVEAEAGPQIHHTDPQVNPAGGSFFSSLKHFVNKLSRGVQSGAQFAERLAPAITALNPEVGMAVGQAARGVGSLAALGRAATGGGRAGGGRAGGYIRRRRY